MRHTRSQEYFWLALAVALVIGLIATIVDRLS
jgi:hypothetical protein